MRINDHVITDSVLLMEDKAPSANELAINGNMMNIPKREMQKMWAPFQRQSEVNRKSPRSISITASASWADTGSSLQLLQFVDRAGALKLPEVVTVERHPRDTH